MGVMLEILSLIACGWLLMYNPSDSWKRPLSELEQTWAFDSASECEGFLTRRFERAEKETREFKHERYRCVRADAVYPHTTPKK
jgi:hypothetical protein